jgi:hypothetical protein
MNPFQSEYERVSTIAESLDFWRTEAAKALCEMMQLAFDFSSQSTEKFAQAQKRFEFARGRAQLEIDRI